MRSFREMRDGLRKDLLSLASFLSACEEIEFGKIEILVQRGKPVQWNITMTEREDARQSERPVASASGTRTS